MRVEIKYIPLSFITTDEEILKQIKNTVLFSHLFQSFESTSLNFYLESTQYGYTASASEKGTHQLVRITDINSGNVNWNTVPYCDCDVEDKYLLKDDDILVARTGGTTGKSFVVNSAPKNAVFASYLIRLRFKEDVNLDFITSFLNSYVFWSQIVEMKSGSAMPNVNAEKLKTLIIPKLGIKEQNEFVTAFKNIENKDKKNTIFEKIDEVESLYINSKEIINELTHQLDLIKQLRQAFLREAMQGKFVKSTNTKETGLQLLEKIKAEKAQLITEKKLKKEKELPPITEDEIPFEIPEHWAWCRLGDISSIVRGGSPRPAGDPKFYNGDIPFLKVGDLTGYEGKYCNTFTHTIKKAGLFKTRYVEANTLMLTNSGATLGVPRICTFPTTFNDGIAAFLGIENLNKEFLFFFLREKSDFFLKEASRGQGQPNLNTDIIGNTLIPLPPIHEQEQIVVKLDELMAFCDGLEQSIRESQGYNEMLLQQVLREALQPSEEA